MAERRGARRENVPPSVRSELPARFADGAGGAIFKDAEWADQADALVNAIFVRGHLKRVAEAVSADIVTQAKAGRTLAEISLASHSKSEEQRAAYRVGLDEAPQILKGRLKQAPAPKASEAKAAAKAACGEMEQDRNLERWADKLIKDVEAWRRAPRNPS